MAKNLPPKKLSSAGTLDSWVRGRPGMSGAYGAWVTWVLPSVCLGGLGLNVLCGALFAVGSRGRGRGLRRGLGLGRGLSTLLAGLCGFDAAALGLSLPVVVAAEAEAVLGERAGLHQLAALSIRFLYPLLMSAHCASIWTICAICSIRYAAVCHPLASRHRCGLLRRHRALLGLIAVAAVLLNLPRFAEFALVPASDPALGYDLRLTALRRSRLYLVINDGLLYPSFLFFLPLALLSALYARVYWAIHTAPKSQPRLSTVSGLSWREQGSERGSAKGSGRGHGPGWERRSSGRGGEEWRSGVMLGAIVGLFFGCHWLAVGLRWWELADESLTAAAPPSPAYRLLNLLSNTAVLANSAANPLVYFCFRASPSPPRPTPASVAKPRPLYRQPPSTFPAAILRSSRSSDSFSVQYSPTSILPPTTP